MIFFETFYELEDDKIVAKKDDDGIDKEKLMLDTDDKSIATRTRSSRRSEGTSIRGTPTGTRVSFGDSVASPITVGTTAAGSTLTMADVQSMVSSTVLPMIAQEVAKEFNGMQSSLSSVVTQMQDNMTQFQQHQQQQLQQFQQQQMQFQQQQQQWFHQQFETQTPIQNNHEIHNMEVITREQQQLMYQQQQQLQQQQQQHQPQHHHQQQHPHQTQPQHQFLAAHPMEGEQHPS
jgi:hypothetical protein